MKYCISSSKENISKLPKGIEEVLLARPLRLSKLKELVLEKGVRKIYCSKSCISRTPLKSRKFLEEQGVVFEMESFRGKPLSTSMEKILEFNELRKDGLSYRKIAEKLGISKSTAHYLNHYSQRKKLKNKGRILSA